MRFKFSTDEESPDGATRGKALPCRGKRTGCAWRQDDFGRDVYVRVKRMKTEALKGQIWQVPYLVAYWFWRGRTVIWIIWGIIFRTMHNNIGV